MAGAHWQPQDIAKEIHDLETLLEHRPSLHERRESLVLQIKMKIEAVQNLSTTALLELYRIIEGSRLPKDAVQALIAALDAKAEAHPTATKVQLRPQQCDAVAEYLTEAELAKLESGSMWAGASVIASRLRLLGIRSMKESTKKMGTALLLLFEWKRVGKVPAGDAAYVLSQQFLQAFQSCRQTPLPGAASLAAYPADPLDLPPGHLKASYGDDAPARKSFPDLQWILRSTPVRATSKQVSHEKAPAPWLYRLLFSLPFLLVLASTCFSLVLQAATSGPSTPAPAEAKPASPGKALTEALLPVLHRLLTKTTVNSPPREPAIEFLKDKQMPVQNGCSGALQPPPSVLPLPAPVCVEAEDRVPSPAGSGPGPAPLRVEEPEANGRKRLEAFEEDAFQKLQAKKARGMKRPAASHEKSLAAPQTPGAPQATGLKLGCKKCRGTAKGCDQCRNPSYKGQRMNRAEWKAFAAERGDRLNGERWTKQANALYFADPLANTIACNEAGRFWTPGHACHQAPEAARFAGACAACQ